MYLRFVCNVHITSDLVMLGQLEEEDHTKEGQELNLHDIVLPSYCHAQQFHTRHLLHVLLLGYF